ncbi:MAG: hypothetical protein M1829_000284 [Trizodia sp. TS-e1964]|nr:MAG: hypothetical protein M1829_000284 [Trizodia sp. TS-e1964]
MRSVALLTLLFALQAAAAPPPFSSAELDHLQLNPAPSNNKNNNAYPPAPKKPTPSRSTGGTTLSLHRRAPPEKKITIEFISTFEINQLTHLKFAIYAASQRDFAEFGVQDAQLDKLIRDVNLKIELANRDIQLQWSSGTTRMSPKSAAVLQASLLALREYVLGYNNDGESLGGGRRKVLPLVAFTSFFDNFDHISGLLPDNGP